jgi:ABC-type lipoprotein release transport system permease subunit
MIFIYGWRLVIRNPRRTLTYLFGQALAVGLFAGILFFVDATSRQMTETTIASIQLDLVAHAVTPNMDLSAVADQLSAQHGIQAVEPVSVADFISATRTGENQVSPGGRLFAIRPSYFQTFDLVRISQGSLNPDGVMVGEELAISLGLRIGDNL